MITGFNTDIKYEGVTYHVQTEDKGLDTPLILSLIYDGGTILASKRSPYEDLLADKFDEKVLAERLSRQHKLLCAAIRAGRLEDLKRMTMKESALKKGLVATKEVKKDVPIIAKNEVQEVVEEVKKEVKAEPVEKSIPKPADEIVIKKPVRTKTYISELQEKIKSAKSKLEKPTSQTKNQIINEIPANLLNADNEVLIIEDVQIIEEPTIYDAVQEIGEEEIILPPEAVEIIGDLSQFKSLIDDELHIKFIGGDKFQSGEHKNINILVCRGNNEENAVKDANVIIKVLGSSFRPLIFHSKTDSNGIASLMLKIPTFKSGRAAILVRASITGEETEIRRVILPEV
ncbi:MAG: hypothetical protein ACR2J3_00385 [Aridibacter sp.]